MLYGYDTLLPGSLSKESIEDLGSTLLERITSFRGEDGTSSRPIIFIGHSLGGLLVKEALVRAGRRRSDAKSDFLKACFGLLFFGVPNLGLRNEQLRTLVRGQPNEALIHDLLVDKESEPSTFLKRLADQFSESCQGRYRVVSFFERQLSRTIELDGEGKPRKTGPPSLLVTEKSATSHGLVAVADEDNISFNKDHSGLVKFDSRSQSEYTIVRARIKSLVEEAKEEVAKRFAEHNIHLPHSEMIHSCLRSLAFEDIDGRQNKIEAAAADTCEWLFVHKNLKQWASQSRGLLWIKGKPGSGKSTLMKHALERALSVYGADAFVLSFFFHGRGHELQRTPLGFFRSLLHQLLQLAPGAVRDLVDHFEIRSKTVGEPGVKWQWDQRPLQTFLESSLTKVLQRFPVVIFVDALDECDEQSAVALIDYLKDLLAKIPPTNLRFGICFSSRHYPVLELKSGLTILLDTENTKDITTYIRGRFHEEQDVPIQNLISRHAEGVFLWAHFVVDRILRLKRQGESRIRIESEIKKMPPDLEDLYLEIIKAVEDPPRTLQLMQWICFAKRPLTTNELFVAMALSSDFADLSLDECQNPEDVTSDERMRKRIMSLSYGMAEIIPSYNARRVQFIHQSVKDFFINRGLLYLDKTMEAHLVTPTAHCRLTWSCIRYFKLVFSSHPEDLVSNHQSRFPLLLYATTSLVHHMQQGEVSETFEEDLIRMLGPEQDCFIEKWAVVYRLLARYERDRPSCGGNLAHIAARYRLFRLLSFIDQNVKEISLDSKDTDYERTPLSWAAGSGHDDIVKMLLDTGKVEVDSMDNSNRSALSWAAGNGHEAIVQMLLDTNKAEVDSRDYSKRSPLSRAAGGGHEAIVKILLDTNKVEVDSRDYNDQSPLSWAAGNGHEAVVDMLLDTNKVEVDSRDYSNRSPLSWAAGSGHDDIVKMLLDTGKVEVDSMDNSNRSALSWAAGGGHEAIVKILLDTNKVEVDSRDYNDQSPLSWAAGNGHEAVVDMLLDTNEVEVDSRDHSNRSPLSWAAGSGDEAIVKRLLATKKVDVCSKDHNNHSPLSFAVENGHRAVAKVLLNTDSVNTDLEETRYKQLYWAAESGNTAVVKIILEEGVDANVQGGEECGNALQVASCRGHMDIVQILLENGADINAQGGDYHTALQAASFGNHMDIVQVLLRNGANANAQGGEYHTALQAASYEDHMNIVQVLLENGADVDAQSNFHGTALLAASLNGHIDIVQVLLEQGADVNAQSGLFGNAVQAASFGGHKKVVQILLEQGADVNIQSGIFGNALQAALFAGNTEIVQTLFEKVADINVQSGMFGNALQAASIRGDMEAIEALLERGANFDVQSGRFRNALQAASYAGQDEVVSFFLDIFNVDSEVKGPGSGRTALSYAAEGGHTSTIEELIINAYANPVSIEDLRRTPLFYASLEGHDEAVKALLLHGSVASDWKDHYGSTPLSAAARRGHTDVVKSLLSTGFVDVSSSDHFGRTPLWWATRYGHTEVVELLVEAGKRSTCKDDDQMFVKPTTPSDMGSNCDICCFEISLYSKFYHCSICIGGDLDICLDCYQLGGRCLEESHELTMEVFDEETYISRIGGIKSLGWC
nr:ankyrin repeat-containing protein [Colletotrichum truncatum]KAF6797901.1 ankyrin repeat-containing protein [Colletotrichum truncatum]